MKLLDDYILQAGNRSLIIKENEAAYHTNREFKDGMFRLLFGEEKAALELLNALEETSWAEAEKIEIDTLEGALYKRSRNDLAFQYDSVVLSIVEHMSTWNENMPLRDLVYLGRTYEKILPAKALHREKRCEIPIPRFYVLYNGLRDRPLETTQWLSDAFPACEIKSMMAMSLKVININYHKQHSILERSPLLNQYAQFVERVRRHMKQAETNGEKVDRDEAIRTSVESCIKDGILEDFLRKHGSEVYNMLMDITWEEFWNIRMEEAEEIGEKKAWEKAEQKMRDLESKAEKEREKAEKERMKAEEKERQLVINLLDDGCEVEKIHKLTNMPLNKIQEIQAGLEA
ncbi:hypothetical protein D3Z38_04145 [Clostridiales bacterium]|nr:hypothetical protein [Clostridiales bacterium]